MRTVGELSEFTGISVRTLHYYDEIGQAYMKRVDDIFHKIADRKEEGASVQDFQVKSVIGELDFVMKQFVQVESVENLLLMIANWYRSDKQRRDKLNGQYGSGMAEYIADAIETFYGK